MLVNNFNRLAPLRRLVDWLGSLPDPVALVILDNGSDYPPLLDYYARLPTSVAQVLRLRFNSGLWGLSHVVAQRWSWRRMSSADGLCVQVGTSPGWPCTSVGRGDAMRASRSCSDLTPPTARGRVSDQSITSKVHAQSMSPASSSR